MKYILGLVLFLTFISQSNAEGPSKHFQFKRLNQSYQNIASEIKEVKSGPLIIRLSSPKHRLILHSHGLQLRGKGDKIYHSQLVVDIEGRGYLLAEIDFFGLRQSIKDQFQIPRQKKEVVGDVRVEREALGYRITPIKIQKTVSVNIHSDLGKQLVSWCKNLPLPLMDCADLDRVISQLTFPLPQDKAFFIKDADLRDEERAALQQYFQKIQPRP